MAVAQVWMDGNVRLLCAIYFQTVKDIQLEFSQQQVVSPNSKRVLGLVPSRGLSVWSSHVLTVSAWVSPGSRTSSHSPENDSLPEVTRVDPAFRVGNGIGSSLTPDGWMEGWMDEQHIGEALNFIHYYAFILHFC